MKLNVPKIVSKPTSVMQRPPLVITRQFLDDVTRTLGAALRELEAWHPSCRKVGCTQKPCDSAEAIKNGRRDHAKLMELRERNPRS